MSASSSPSVDVPLTGWGRYPTVQSQVQRPEKVAALTELVQNAGQDTVLPRGAGRSYGDAALNASGQTVLMERLNRMLTFNEQTGILSCEAGVTFQDILDVFVPRGWFPSVTPGTKFPTMGGAVAADVHGKNHHVDGAFSSFLNRLTLVLASGKTVQCSRDENSDLFWATVGGMGLTGMITEVEVALRPIQTAYIKGISLKAKNLDDAMALFEEYEPQYQYSVAWIDCLAGGGSLGRSLISFGNHATLEDLPAAQRANPLAIAPKRRLKVPVDPPSGLLNRYTMNLFNILYYTKQVARQVDFLEEYDPFFYPLDFVGDWNRLYGKNGFTQYQCVLPPETSHEGMTRILELCSQKGCGSFLAVLKRMGPQQGWLSFPMAGYTLALDMPVKPGLWEFLEQLDQVVIHYGGRVYLAKDARLSPESFRKMYPAFPQWLALKSEVDPDNRFSSVLSDRLKIQPVRERVQL